MSLVRKLVCDIFSIGCNVITNVATPMLLQYALHYIQVLYEYVENNYLPTGVLDFLEFGDSRKVITNRDSSDAASEPISLPSGFPFGSEIHTLAYVSV